MSTVQQDFQDSETAEAVAEAREWIAANWSGTAGPQWRRVLAEAGWAALTWPKENFGRGLSEAAAREVLGVFEEAGVPGAGLDLGSIPAETFYVQIMGNILQAFGTPEQKREWLPQYLSGLATRTCLFYSEPGAGSDLAGLQTRAERDGDEYVINGQKIWTSGARRSDYGLLICRTDWDVPKHAGLSYFIMPVRVPGVEIRPIKQMTGGQEFNEVFFTDARVPAKNMIGQINDGWRVLNAALMSERAAMGGAYAKDDEAEDAPAEIFTRSQDLIDAARAAGLDQDSATRQELMRIHSWRLVKDWNSERAGALLRGGGSSSSLASLAKLANSRVLHSAAAFKYRMQGQRGLEYDYEADRDASSDEVNMLLMRAFVNSIGGGSDQIQRNVISERVLGLPKGPEPDKGVPFRDVRKGVAPRALS